jgi:hypothetical protein
MLWSITLRFEYKVATIKESKDLSEMSIDELQDLSATHEHCLNSKKSTEFKKVYSIHWRCITISVEHDDKGGSFKHD